MSDQQKQIDAVKQSCCKTALTEVVGHCFHCQEPLTAHGMIYADIDGRPRKFCGQRCKQAAAFIEKGQHLEFYKRRDKDRGFKDTGAPGVLNTTNTDWSFLDESAIGADYVSRRAGERELRLQLQGLYCASCAWLIEDALKGIDRDIQSHLDTASQRLDVRVRNERTQLSTIVSTIETLGYQPGLIATQDYHQSENGRDEQRRSLKRIAVAGFGMMQVMTYMVGVYLGEFEGIDPSYHRFLTLVSMLVATVVVFYSGKPYFENAINDLFHGRLGMDVPIALAIAGAFFPSVYLTLLNIPGHVYFDSAVMFIFFLSVGRFVEARARFKMSAASRDIDSLFPPLISIKRAGQAIFIKVAELQPGDHMELSTGQRMPFDGKILAGSSMIDESFVTGESRSLVRKTGDLVLAGSIVLGDSLKVEAISSWEESSIAKIASVLKRADLGEPTPVTAFDYLARHFVVFVLVLTAAVALIWWQLDSTRVFEICLAMLVASCPCAFALAGPAGIASASHALRLKGMLVANHQALGKLSRVTTWVFDKTGTLTKGRPSIKAIQLFADINEQQVLQLAASLEQDQRHVLSASFSSSLSLLPVTKLERSAGNGVSGMINHQRVMLGRPEWVSKSLDKAEEVESYCVGQSDASLVALTRNGQLLAIFEIEDQLRPESTTSLNELKRQGFRLAVMSGDRAPAVQSVCSGLPLDSIQSDLMPGDKLEALKQLQANSEIVAMVGDGINDAPVISQADISLAMSSGSELSMAQADIVIVNGRLSSLTSLVQVAQNMNRITQQNWIWALSYNGLILPLAAFGLITPWLAALGMSISSLLVVLNALRIGHRKLPNRRTRVHTEAVA